MRMYVTCAFFLSSQLWIFSPALIGVSLPRLHRLFFQGEVDLLFICFFFVFCWRLSVYIPRIYVGLFTVFGRDARRLE